MGIISGDGTQVVGLPDQWKEFVSLLGVYSEESAILTGAYKFLDCCATFRAFDSEDSLRFGGVNAHAMTS